MVLPYLATKVIKEEVIREDVILPTYDLIFLNESRVYGNITARRIDARSDLFCYGNISVLGDSLRCEDLNVKDLSVFWTIHGNNISAKNIKCGLRLSANNVIAEEDIVVEGNIGAKERIKGRNILTYGGEYISGRIIECELGYGIYAGVCGPHDKSTKVSAEKIFPDVSHVRIGTVDIRNLNKEMAPIQSQPKKVLARK